MIGNTLGNYTILDEIGSGGMGSVYRAHDTKLGRDVAIKVILRTSPPTVNPSRGSSVMKSIAHV